MKLSINKLEFELIFNMLESKTDKQLIKTLYELDDNYLNDKDKKYVFKILKNTDNSENYEKLQESILDTVQKLCDNNKIDINIKNSYFYSGKYRMSDAVYKGFSLFIFYSYCFGNRKWYHFIK